MRSHYFIIVTVLFLLSPANAFTLLSEGYTLENYAQYSSVTDSRRMVFDDTGNLYINHRNDGKIVKVDTNAQASVFATGLELPYDITWG